MGASVQRVSYSPSVWVLRAGPDHSKYGEPYTFAATVVETEKPRPPSGRQITIMGAAGQMTPKIWRASREVILENLHHPCGLEVTWERKEVSIADRVLTFKHEG